MFVVYAQRIGRDRFVTWNAFEGLNHWREEMAADGFTRQMSVNTFSDPATGNIVRVLGNCATAVEANGIVKLANSAIRFALYN